MGLGQDGCRKKALTDELTPLAPRLLATPCASTGQTWSLSSGNPVQGKETVTVVHVGTGQPASHRAREQAHCAARPRLGMGQEKGEQVTPSGAESQREQGSQTRLLFRTSHTWPQGRALKAPTS